DPGPRAQALRMEGAIRFADGRGGDTPSLLFDAAMGLREIDPGQARETLLEAMEAAMWAGRLTSGTTMVDVAEAALAPPAADGDRSTGSLMLTGYSQRLRAGYPRGVEWWRRAAEVGLDGAGGESNLQTLGMLWNATGELFDFENHVTVARRRVRLAR